MRKSVICAFLFVLATSSLFSQDKILMTIGDRKVTTDEFERIYRKNNPEGQQNDRKVLDEYLDLFINFKLKVIEAENMKLDTNPNFTRELEGYRKQLAAPYLVDQKVDESLLRETYERMLWDVKAKHILIMLDENAPDTTEAWKKISDIRKRALAGESFDSLAVRYSEDPSAKTNYGDLGYFTVFQMLYPFETAAFNTPVGKISEVIRTRFGYHVIQVTDKRKSRGEVKVAHIMVALPKDAGTDQQVKAEAKIKDIFTQIKNGADFTKMAEEMSDDKTSARKGGELNWFGTGRMVPEFEAAAFAIPKVGDVSEPIRTAFGWHIIKKLEEKPVGSYDELKSALKNKVSKDGRNSVSRTALVSNLKKEYNYKDFPKNLQELYKLDTAMLNQIPDAAFRAKYSKPLFVIGDSTYTQYQLLNAMASAKRKEKPEVNKMTIEKQFQQLVERSVIAYEEARLDMKYPDFRFLMQEYHDGILLFDLTDKMVWSKAVKDSAGLAEFYEQHKNNYMWPERAEVSFWDCSDAKEKENVMKYLAKNLSAGFDEEKFLAAINKKNPAAVGKISLKLYLQGDDKNVDQFIWQNKELVSGKHPAAVSVSDKQIAILHRMVKPEPKKLNEARGLITADYQNYLEKIWIEQLRSKYPVQVNTELFKTIKP
jgi:peptidyl-prolyl cis-trans isomerase SurA